MERRALAVGLKTWFDLLLGIVGLFMVLVTLWLLIAPLSGAAGNRGADIAIPVAIGDGKLRPGLDLEVPPNTSLDVTTPRIVDGRGELRFTTTKLSLHFLTLSTMLLGMAIVLWGFSWPGGY